MKAASLNQFQADLIIDELVRCGLRLFCISPGSRNSPLVIAAAEHPDAETVVHFDERGAAFYAVGYARGSGKPAALICTSGTAVANYLPAVVESHESQTPLIVLTADRPSEAMNRDSYQTIDQREIFGRFTNTIADLQLGDAALKPEHLLGTVDYAFAQATSGDAGPAHLNCRFREPLAPLGKPVDFSDSLAELGDWQSSDQPYSQIHPLTFRGAAVIPELIEEKLSGADRGVIIAGVLPDSETGAVLRDLACRWQWPLISDIGSQTRFSSSDAEAVISYADNYLRLENVAESLSPDVVVQFGRTPISKFVAGYAARAESAYIVVAPGLRRIDPYHHASDRISLDCKNAALALGGLSPPQSTLLSQFLKLDQLAQKQIDLWFTKSDDALIGSMVAAEICGAGNSERALYLATSMSIREANSFATATNLPVMVGANRGANGIDGTIASAAGFARAARKHTTLLTGDLAMLHDLNSLALVKESDTPLTIVILNNDGGEIFSYLPVAKVEAHFEKFFRVPHRLNFAHAADMFGIKYYQPMNFRDFSTIYRHSINGGRSVIIELKIDRDRNVIQHREFWNSLQEEIGAMAEAQP